MSFVGANKTSLERELSLSDSLMEAWLNEKAIRAGVIVIANARTTFCQVLQLMCEDHLFINLGEIVSASSGGENEIGDGHDGLNW